MSFKATVCAMEYRNIDGTGWPDAVIVENDGDPMAGTYEIRTYHPVDYDALLKLADEMGAYTGCDDERCGKVMPPRDIHDYARRIREALGVEE